MADIDMDKILGELKRMRDELALQIHLGTKEAQDEWSDLEEKWEKFSADAKLKSSAGDIGAAVGSVGDELKAAYERIKKALD